MPVREISDGVIRCDVLFTGLLFSIEYTTLVLVYSETRHWFNV